MRVLWFVPTPVSAVRTRLGVPHNDGGWWIDTLLSSLRTHGELQLGVVWASEHVARTEEFTVDGVQYFCIPHGRNASEPFARVWRRLDRLGITSSTKVMLQSGEQVVQRFRPDLIHVHGSERPYGLIAETVTCPAVLSIQGILSEYAKLFFGQVPWTNRFRIPSLWLDYWHMCRRAELERRIFKACGHFLGRTLWDASHQAELNPFGQYHHGGELLRPEFARAQWQREKVKRHLIYITSSCLPYKGIDILIRAISLVRKHIPETQLRIGGNVPTTGFGRYLRNLVKRLDLTEAVTFLGWIPAAQIAFELETAHAFVLPSLIENSPNSLAEAQTVGTPVVASACGGTPSMVADGQTGLLFPPGDVAVLAMCLRRLFGDDELCVRLSENGRQTASARHDPEFVVEGIVQAYQQVCLQTEAPGTPVIEVNP